MSILLSDQRRKQALHHLEEFLKLTVYYKIPYVIVGQISEHLAHLAASTDDLNTTVKIASNEAVRRTMIEITMDLKGKQDVSLQGHN